LDRALTKGAGATTSCAGLVRKRVYQEAVQVCSVRLVAHFLLLHGACHGGWCWDAVASILRSAGHQTTAPDFPCEDLAAGLSESADVAVASLRGAADVVVVGHSLGALVAPLVADRVPVRRMVMLAGIVGAPRASLESLAAEDADRDLPLTDADLETDAEGRFRFSRTGARRVLYHDCSPEAADAATARLRFQRSMWTEVADFDAWPEVETVSITCADDRLVNPSWSNRVARERLGVEPLELPGGHSPFLARPAALAEVLVADL
jgi:pimeloyl-ACP methyl ester carboxylesterase